MASEVRCPQCDYPNSSNARYCTRCGGSLNAPAGTTGSNASLNQFARRVLAEELALQSGRYVVPSGYTALILKDNAVIETHVGPVAINTSGSWWGRTFDSRSQSTVFLVNNAEIPLEFSLSDLYTQDPISLHAYCRLVVQLKNPQAFVQNVLRDHATFGENDLREFLRLDVQEAAQVFISERTADQIDSELKERRELFGTEISERMRSTFAASGIDFLRVQILNVFHPRLNENRKVEEELYLGPGELDQRKRLFDLYDQQQLALIAAEETEVAHAQKRSAIRQRLAKLALDDKIGDIRTIEEFDAFLAQIDRDHLLRADDAAQFRETLLNNKEDRDRQRARVVALAGVQDAYDIRQAQLERKFGFEQALLQSALTLARQETVGRLEIEQTRVTLELERAKQVAEHERAQRQQEERDARERAAQDSITQLQLKLNAAQNQAEIARLQIDLERLQDELDLATLDRVQSIDRNNREEKLRIERENEIALLQARLDADERQFKLRIEEMRNVFDQKVALAALPLESQLGILDPENAQIVAKLLDTRELKGMTPEQLEIIMADRGPGVVEVVKARYASILSQTSDKLESEHLRALLDVLEKQRDSERTSTKETLDRFDTQRREEAERQERMTGKAFDSLTDVAKSFAQRPESGVTFVSTGQTGYVAGNVAGTAQPGAMGDATVQICPKCQMRMPVGTKFCSNCGHKFYD